MAISAGERNTCQSSLGLIRFHFEPKPNPMEMINNTIKGTNAALKYGGPTDIFPPPTASNNNGYKVPNNTVKAATISKILLDNKKVSRDQKRYPTRLSTVVARSANNNKEPPTVMANNTNT